MPARQTVYSTLIDCTPEQLWPWLEEPDKQKQWMKGLLENVSTSEGPTRVGSTFRMTIQEGRRVAEYEGEITNYDLHHRLSVKMWGKALRGVEIYVDHQLQDLGGRTRLDYISSADASGAGFFMKLMLRLYKIFGMAQLKRFMKTLKHLAETEAVQAPVAG